LGSSTRRNNCSAIRKKRRQKKASEQQKGTAEQHDRKEGETQTKRERQKAKKERQTPGGKNRDQKAMKELVKIESEWWSYKSMGARHVRVPKVVDARAEDALEVLRGEVSGNVRDLVDGEEFVEIVVGGGEIGVGDATKDSVLDGLIFELIADRKVVKDDGAV
jgi:hypothetical protein